MEDIWERLDAMRNGRTPVQQGSNISPNLQQRLDNMRKGVSTAATRTSSGNTTTVGRDDLGAPQTYTSVGGDAHIAPKTSQQSTNTKPLTGFAAGVQANNAGYKALAQKKVDKILNEPEQPLTGFAAGVQANNEGYRQLAEKPSFGNYVGRKFVGGAAERIEGTANAAGYWYQGMVKSGELQHNNALQGAAASTKNPYAKAAMESHIDEYGIDAQQTEEITQRPTKAIANFGDNYVAKTEEKFADADFGKVGNLIGDVAQGAGGMLAKFPANFVPGLGSLITFASAYGNAKQSAQKQGADESSASLYALGTATVELATEKMLGFTDFAGKGALDDIAKEYIAKLAKSEAGKTALNTILGAVGEGAEEFIAELGQSYINKLTIGTDTRNWKELNKDAWYNALVGGITGVVVSTANVISGGDGKLPTANEIEELTTWAAEETSEGIKARIGAGNIDDSQGKSDLMMGEVRAERDALGNVTVVINADILAGKPKAEWRKTISNELQRIFHNGVKLPRGVVFSNKKGRGEFTNGSYTRMLERTDPAMYEDKMRMATGTEELLKNAENIINEDPAHNRADDIVSFNRGNFRVKVKGAGYTGDILTAIYSDGKEVFFDINNLERNKNEATPERYAFDNAKGFSQTGVASKLNIPQAKNEVNGVTASEQYPLLYTEYLKSKGQLPTNRMLYTERLLKQAEKSGDIYTQRILQSEIEKAKKNFELEASNDADVNTIARLSQNEEDVRPPVEYDGDFEEFLDLNISNDEGKALSAVWKESRKSGFEYGIVIEGGEIRDLVTSNMANTVGVDLENYGYGLTLLHSHTNATPFSIADFRMLLNEKVDRIGVVGYNGDAFVAYIGYGDRPMLEEFEEAARKIRREVDLEIPNYTNFYDWTLAERNYMAIREQAFRIARYFGWTLEGGRLDVE